MKQRGVALITAIVLVAIATMLATHVFTRAALDVRRTAGLVAMDQGWHVALGAEAWAAEVLSDDFDNDPAVDHLGEAWAQPLPPLPVDGGEVRGAVEDMQGRFNLNNLRFGNVTTREASIARFERMLVFAGADQRWARIMADWVDEDTVSGIPEGAEDGTYLSQNPPYRAANRAVTTTTEMMALPGMTRDEFERIRPFVAALPAGTPINICTAKAPVLAALDASSADFGNAEILATNRKDGCYPTIEVLRGQLGNEVVDNLITAETIAENTDWFRTVTAVRIGTSELTLYSLMNRDSAGSSRTVLRSKGAE
jgi:general secretion pathway protein K